MINSVNLEISKISQMSEETVSYSFIIEQATLILIVRARRKFGCDEMSRYTSTTAK